MTTTKMTTTTTRTEPAHKYKSKNKNPKYNTPGDDDDSMDNFDMAKSYPHLARALEGKDGFDPTNPSV